MLKVVSLTHKVLSTQQPAYLCNLWYIWPPIQSFTSFL